MILVTGCGVLAKPPPHAGVHARSRTHYRKSNAISSEVSWISARRDRPWLPVRPGSHLRRESPAGPRTRRPGASSRTCEPSSDRRSPPEYAPHSPTRITKTSILKFAGAFQGRKTSSIRFWAFSYSIGEPCGRSNQLIMYFIAILLILGPRSDCCLDGLTRRVGRMRRAKEGRSCGDCGEGSAKRPIGARCKGSENHVHGSRFGNETAECDGGAYRLCSCSIASAAATASNTTVRAPSHFTASGFDASSISLASGAARGRRLPLAPRLNVRAIARGRQPSIDARNGAQTATAGFGPTPTLPSSTGILHGPEDHRNVTHWGRARSYLQGRPARCGCVRPQWRQGRCVRPRGV